MLLQVRSETRKRILAFIIVSNRRYKGTRNLVQEFINQYKGFWKINIYKYVLYSLDDGLESIDVQILKVPVSISYTSKIDLYTKFDKLLLDDYIYNPGNYNVSIRYNLMKLSYKNLLKCVNIYDVLSKETPSKILYLPNKGCRAELACLSFDKIYKEPSINIDKYLKLIMFVLHSKYDNDILNVYRSNFIKEKIESNKSANTKYLYKNLLNI